jgi:pimeloyl-ACP methyl ester carboxylesterase
MIGELRLIEAPDGRRLEVLTAGPAAGRVLVMHEGTPAGPVALRSMVDDAAARGLRTVLCARPGYGRSDPLPGRTVADVVPDTATVLDGLGLGEFITVGWSGGGPHALACAAGLPGRCLAAATMAGVAPYPAEGLDWLAGMGPENVTEFGAAVAGRDDIEAFLAEAVAGMADLRADKVAEELGGLASEADKAVLTGEFAEFLAESQRAAVSNGAAGWRDDDLAFAAYWGFTPAEAGAGAPVSIWQGDQDLMVPWAHGEWLAAHVAGARAHMLHGEGHLTLAVTVFGQILDDLLDLAGWPAHQASSG